MCTKESSELTDSVALSGSRRRLRTRLLGCALGLGTVLGNSTADAQPRGPYPPPGQPQPGQSPGQSPGQYPPMGQGSPQWQPQQQEPRPEDTLPSSDPPSRLTSGMLSLNMRLGATSRVSDEKSNNGLSFDVMPGSMHFVNDSRYGVWLELGFRHTSLNHAGNFFVAGAGPFMFVGKEIWFRYNPAFLIGKQEGFAYGLHHGLGATTYYGLGLHLSHTLLSDHGTHHDLSAQVVVDPVAAVWIILSGGVRGGGRPLRVSGTARVATLSTSMAWS